MNDDASSDARDGAKVCVLPPLLYLGSIALGVMLNWFWTLGFAGGSVLRIVLGVALVCTGVAASWSAFSVFKRMGQDPNPRTSTPEVTREGPYRFTRNPMYIGLSLIQSGVGVALGNVWILILLVPTIIVMHYGVILREEEYLERKFGEEYLRFKSSVRRWV
jgi:protein-S-isoprenylcysteine O-methyltransferase Ste14